MAVSSYETTRSGAVVVVGEESSLCAGRLVREETRAVYLRVDRVREASCKPKSGSPLDDAANGRWGCWSRRSTHPICFLPCGIGGAAGRMVGAVPCRWLDRRDALEELQ